MSHNQAKVDMEMVIGLDPPWAYRYRFRAADKCFSLCSHKYLRTV